jgi:transcriptional regulator with XRE-family HTH domain
MGNSDQSEFDTLIARRLRELRNERSWSLDELAKCSGVSRATLSRLENAEVSASASMLGKLCRTYGLTMSRLMQMVEGQFEPLIKKAQQVVWLDPETGFRRCSVSPPAASLSGEALYCELPPNAYIPYDGTPKQGLEHHLVLVEGAIDITVEGQCHSLKAGDCLRYQLFGPSSYRALTFGAKYYLFIV